MVNLLRRKGGAIYFGICMLVFLFFVYSGNDGNYWIDNPHIEISVPPLYVVLAVSLVFFSSLFAQSQAKGDLLSFLLLVPFFIHLTNSIYMGLPSKFYVLFTTSFLSLSSYLIAVNMNDEVRYLEKVFLIVFIVLSSQIFIEFLLSDSAEANIIYSAKHEMRIPIGGSNALCPILLSFFAFLFCRLNSKKHRILLCIITISAIMMTRSRGGLIDLVVIIAALWLCSNRKNSLFWGRAIVIFLCMFGLLYMFWNYLF